VATAGFELAKVVVPGLLDVGVSRVKSALVVVYEELGNVSAPSVVLRR
jgi:hypothetical protein